MNNFVDLTTPSVSQYTAPVAPVEPTMFKTPSRYNIDVLGLTRKAREDISAVQTIYVPAPVKTHKRQGQEFETPVLSEVGGGVGKEFCQVIAEPDGRPISIDNVLYMNNDPARASINHGTVSVAIGGLFSVYWRTRAEGVLLIYEIVDIDELTIDPPREDEPNTYHAIKAVARLTCELIGHQITTWRGPKGDIPRHLKALWMATEQRMKDDIDVPVYMDVFRMMKQESTSLETMTRMRAGDVYDVVAVPAVDFMTRVFDEILSIRKNQHAIFVPTEKESRVDRLRAMELLSLNREDNTICVDLLLLRDDNIHPQIIRTILAAETFYNLAGRRVLERGLLLNCATFELLWRELEGRNHQDVMVNLMSIR